MDKQRRVEELNSILNNIATKAGVQYITHDPSFRLADGQPNDGYLLADGLHLSNRGSNRLVKNLGLITTNTNVTSRKKGKQHQRDKENTPTTNDNRIGDQDNDDELDHEFWQHARTKASRRAQRPTQPQRNQPTRRNTRERHNGCEYCGEPGHGTNECGFRDYATCRQCGQHGHKQKLCASYRQ